MKGQSLHLDLILKCGKYRRETYTNLSIKEIINKINIFFENELEIKTKISYNTVMNMLIDDRPKNKLLSNFIIVKKHIPTNPINI
jgi:hypothetical protein